MRFLIMGSFPVGALVGGTLGEFSGLRGTLWVSGTLLTVAALPVYLALRHIRHAADLPSWAPPTTRALTTASGRVLESLPQAANQAVRPRDGRTVSMEVRQQGGQWRAPDVPSSAGVGRSAAGLDEEDAEWHHGLDPSGRDGLPSSWGRSSRRRGSCSA